MNTEQHLAGSILIDEKTISLIQGLVSVDDFQNKQCRAVFVAALSLESEGLAVDPVSIQKRAKRNGVELSNDFLTELMDVTPTAANAPQYALRIAEEARTRRIKSLALSIQTDDVSSSDELLATLQRETQAIGGSNFRKGLLDPSASLRRFTDYVVSVGDGPGNFVPSGYSRLDSILGGGFIRGGMYIVGARPAVGKSSFAVNLADMIRGPVLFVSLEMSPEQIVAKRFSRITGIPTGKLMSGKITEHEWEKIGSASSRLFSSGVYINAQYDLTTQRIQLLAQRVPNLQAIVVDYLGLIQPATRIASAYEKTSEISRDLKKLALSLNVPVICLSQLSRAVEGREDKRPRLSDLRDSGAIEQDADAVMFLYRPDYYTGQAGTAPSVVQLNVPKNRHGGLGQVDFDFFMNVSGFREVSSGKS